MSLAAWMHWIMPPIGDSEDVEVLSRWLCRQADTAAAHVDIDLTDDVVLESLQQRVDGAEHAAHVAASQASQPFWIGLYRMCVHVLAMRLQILPPSCERSTVWHSTAIGCQGLDRQSSLHR